jgi:hypothetical protein
MHLDPHKFAANARFRGYATDLSTLEHFLIEIDPHDSRQ